MESTSRMKMARFQIFWIQMRKNKPLDESRKTNQTFGTKMAFYSLADIDNNGTIDYEEFVAATLHINKVDKEDYLFTAFSYFDKDDSGYITLDELQQACKEFGVDDVHLEEIIKEADQNNDGCIDYNEFVAMMHNGSTPKKQVKDGFSVALRESVPVC
ncbi:putative non-specific serine/threonine protein kinase [Helianthus anomalus]